MWGCVKLNIDMHISWMTQRQVTVYTCLVVMWVGKSHFSTLEVSVPCTYSRQSCMPHMYICTSQEIACTRAMLKQWTSYIICGALVSNMLADIQKMRMNRRGYKVVEVMVKNKQTIKNLILNNDGIVQKVFWNVPCKSEGFFRGTDSFFSKKVKQIQRPHAYIRSKQSKFRE